MEKTRKTIARCVLCKSCANWTGRFDGERRKTRTCGAGLDPTHSLYECGSYVRTPGVVVWKSPNRQASA
jgi:hypothetical protein